MVENGKVKIADQNENFVFTPKLKSVEETIQATWSEKLANELSEEIKWNVNLSEIRTTLNCAIQNSSSSDYTGSKNKSTHDTSFKWHLIEFYKNNLQLLNQGEHKVEYEGETINGVIKDMKITNNPEQTADANYLVKIVFHEGTVVRNP